MKHRLLAFIMIIMMVFTAIPMPVHADDTDADPAGGITVGLETNPLLQGLEVTVSVKGEIINSDSFYACVYLETGEDAWESMGYKYLEKSGDGQELNKAAFKCNNISVFDGVNNFKIEVIKENGSESSTVFSKTIEYEAVPFTVSAEYKEMHANSLMISYQSDVVIDSTMNNHAILYLRENGSEAWEEIKEIYLSPNKYVDANVSGLKFSTPYDVKIVHYDTKRVLYEKESAFTTEEDDRVIILEKMNASASAIVLHYVSESGYNVHEDNYLYFFYKRKSDVEYKFLDFHPAASNGMIEDFITFPDLKSGTEYSILAELKEGMQDDYRIQGVGTVLSKSMDLSTEANDYILKATPTNISSFYADIDLELSKGNGALLPSYNHILLFLKPADKALETLRYDLLLSGDPGNKETFRAEGLRSDMEYSISARYIITTTLQSGETTNSKLMDFNDLGTFRTQASEEARILTITSEKQIIPQSGGNSIHALKGNPFQLYADVIPEDAVNNVEWSTGNEAVAEVDANGRVTPQNAGTAVITALFKKDGQQYLSTTIEVDVFDLTICEKKADGTLVDLEDAGDSFTIGQKRSFMVRDKEKDLEDPLALIPDITWDTDNKTVGEIDRDGVFIAKTYGDIHIYAYTVDGMVIDSGVLHVRNEIKGLTLELESDDSSFIPIAGEKGNDYKISAGVDYKVKVYASSAYTGSDEMTNLLDEGSYSLSTDMGYYVNDGILYIPNSFLKFGGTTVVLTARLDDNEREVKGNVRLYVVDKPDEIPLDQTYVWDFTSQKLKNAPLPDGFAWEEEETPVDGIAGVYDYTYKAFVSSSDFYPLSQDVNVHVFKKPVNPILLNGNTTPSGEYYIKTGKTFIAMLENMETESLPYVEISQLKCSSKNAKDLLIEAGETPGSYQITAAKKGDYTISATYTFYSPEWSYDRLVRGKKIATQTYTKVIRVLDEAPIQTIGFVVDNTAVSNYHITYTGNNLRYDIRSDEENKKNTEKKIKVKLTVFDTENREISRTAKLKIKSSNPSVVSVVRDKAQPDQLNVTIKKNDGKAVITVQGADLNQAAGTLTLDIRNFAPRMVGKYNVVLYKDNPKTVSDHENKIADILVPFSGEQKIKEVKLLKDAKAGVTEENRIKGIDAVSVTENRIGSIHVNIIESEKNQIITNKKLSCFLAVKTTGFEDYIYIPVKLTVSEEMPDVTLKVNKPVNLFYYNTLNEANDSLTASFLKVTASKKTPGVRIQKVEWYPGLSVWDAPDKPSGRVTNNEFRIKRKCSDVSDAWLIDYCYPVLDRNHEPFETAVKGTLYVFLEGYEKPVKKEFEIPTVYKKPGLKAADFNISPGTGIDYAYGCVYTDAYDSYKKTIAAKNDNYAGLYFNSVMCSDKETSVSVDSKDRGKIKLVYSGTKSKDVSVTFGADNWRETVRMKAKIRVKKVKLSLSNPTVLLNSNYPSNTFETYDETFLKNTETGNLVDFKHLDISASGEALKLLNNGVVNIERKVGAGQDSVSAVRVSLNDLRAQGITVKPGTYKYKLYPAYTYNKKLPAVTLNVTIVTKSASVKLKTSGKMNLLLLQSDGSGGVYDKETAVQVKPKFINVSSSFSIKEVRLEGEYAGDFVLYEKDSVSFEPDGTIYVIPREKGILKAGREYQLNVAYTLEEGMPGNIRKIIVRDKIKIKPIQTAPKIKADSLTVYSSNISDVSARFTVPKGYCIREINGQLDVNGDRKGDIELSTKGYFSNTFTVPVRIEPDACALKATKSGTSYKVPVQMTLDGNDGTGGVTTIYITIKIKK